MVSILSVGGYFVGELRKLCCITLCYSSRACGGVRGVAW